MLHPPLTRARALSLLLFVLLSAACTAPGPTVEVPAILTELPERPVPPADPTDRDVAFLLIRQDEVLQACYSQMQRIRVLLGSAR